MHGETVKFATTYYRLLTRVHNSKLVLDTSQPDNPYIREQGYEDPWLFFEGKRGSSASKQVWETVA